MNGRTVHEQIYVHTKAMIVDDQFAIVGSANINDRSLLGSKDSELAAMVEDDNRLKTTFNDKPIWVREFAHGLRKRLWVEHLGLKDDGASVVDFHKGFEEFRRIAKNNTEAYEAVFENVPSDRIRKINAHLAAASSAPASAKAQLDARVQGHAMLFPIKWLFKEALHRRGVSADPFALINPASEVRNA